MTLTKILPLGNMILKYKQPDLDHRSYFFIQLDVASHLLPSWEVILFLINLVKFHPLYLWKMLFQFPF